MWAYRSPSPLPLTRAILQQFFRPLPLMTNVEHGTHTAVLWGPSAPPSQPIPHISQLYAAVHRCACVCVHDTNIRSRVNIPSHMHCQTDECDLIDSRVADNYAGHPHYTVQIPHAIPKAGYQSILGWIAQRVCHTIRGTSMWFHPHSWFSGCQICCNPEYHVPPTVNDSPIAIGQWSDIRPVALNWLHNPPDPIKHVWIWC